MSSQLTINSPETTGSGSTPNGPSTKAKTILVVDDRAINRDFLVSLLKHFGYKMREAESAEQAWGIIAGGDVDLIITDVYMAGIDGLKLLENLAADPRTAHVPAIVYTASHKHADQERLVRARQLYAVLSKPAAPEAIVETVQRALGNQAIAEKLEAGSGTNKASRAATLIEIMQDLAEQREAPNLVQIFCKAAKELIHARDVFVYVFPQSKEVPKAFSSSNSYDHEEIPDHQQLASGM